MARIWYRGDSLYITRQLEAPWSKKPSNRPLLVMRWRRSSRARLFIEFSRLYHRAITYALWFSSALLHRPDALWLQY